MKIKKRIHKMYQECKNANITQLVGKWQYIYTSEKGEISLIKLINYFKDGIDLWEIYGVNIYDTERFKSKKEAEGRIREILK